MDRELTQEEELIKDVSEKENPYANECPNKNLWSEGFRAGYRYAINVCDFADKVLSSSKRPDKS